MTDELPTTPMSFVGREHEVDRVRGLLGEPGLVMVCGAPGVGKSRLAMEALAGYSEPSVRCELSDVATVAGLCARVGEALGETPGNGDEVDIARLGFLLGQRERAALVLDGFDALVSAGAGVVNAWCQAAPQLTVMVTSRERLRLSRERVVELAPLDAATALQLFDARVTAAWSEWNSTDHRDLVGQLVDKLDRLPLAIELAAARMGVIGPQDLLTELEEGRAALGLAPRDAQSHHATLEAAIHASWRGLSAREQQVLSQAAVFRSSFSLVAARAVLDVRGTPPLLEVLHQLRLKSLIRTVGVGRKAKRNRFRLYETVRRYCRRQLDESGDADAVVARHALFFTRADATWEEADLVDIIGVVEDYAVADPALSLRAALGCEPLLWRHGRADEVVRLLSLALSTEVAEAIGVRERVLGLRLRGRANRLLGNSRAAETDLSSALQLCEQLSDDAARGAVLHELATLALFGGRFSEGRELYREAVEAHRLAGDRLGEATALDGVAGCMYESGEDLDDAREVLLEALRIIRGLEAPGKEAIIRGHVGLFALERGLLDEAEAQFHAALDIHRQLGHVRFEAAETANLALIAQEEGELPLALQRLETAVDLQRRAGDIRGVGLTLLDLGTCREEADDIAGAIAAYVEALELSRVVGDTRMTALALGFQGRAAARQGRLEAANKLVDRADAALAKRPNPDSLALLALCRAHLGGTEVPSPTDASSAVRAGLRLLDRERHREGPVLHIDHTAHSFAVTGAPPISLLERPTLWRVLACLVDAAREQPGTAVTREAVFDAGWPGERIAAKSAAGRVRSAVYALRKLGLSSLVASSKEGYTLDPAADIRSD